MYFVNFHEHLRVLTQKQIGLLLLRRRGGSGRGHRRRLPGWSLRGRRLLLLLQNLLHGRRVHGRIGTGRLSGVAVSSALLLHEHELLLLLLLLLLLGVLVLESCL